MGYTGGGILGEDYYDSFLSFSSEETDSKIDLAFHGNRPYGGILFELVFSFKVVVFNTNLERYFVVDYSSYLIRRYIFLSF